MEADEQLLYCPLCQTEYDKNNHEPKLLSCHHSFCLACLLKVDITQTEKPIIRCPTCKKKTTVPSKGIESLKTNIYVAKMKEILKGKVGSTSSRSRTGSQVSSRSDTEVPNVSFPAAAGEGCSKHSNQPLLFYCETCMVAICMHCTVLEHDKLAGHVIKDIQSACAVHMEILADKTSKLEKAMEKRAAFVQLLHAEAGNMNAAKDAALKQLDLTFQQLEQKLQDRKQLLLEELNTMYAKGKERLQGKMLEVKSQAETIKEIQDRCSNVMAANNPAEALRTTTDDKLMAEIDGYFFQSTLQGAGPNFIKFDYNTGLYEFVTSLNQVGKLTMDNYLPSSISLDIKPAVSSIPAQMSVQISCADGAKLDIAVPVTADITDPCNDKVPCKVLHENGLYTIRYRPQMPGNYQVSLEFLGQTIKGTNHTFSVSSNNPIMKIGSEGSGQDRLVHPTSVAIAPCGDVYVADMGNKRIQVFDQSGKWKDKITISKKVNTVYDITINPITEELIFSKVVPNENSGKPEANTIYICDLLGTKKHSFNNSDMKSGLFTAVNSKGWIIATDMSDNKGYIYSKEGRLMKTFGKPGDNEGEFSFPSAVCIGQNDDIVICDTGNHRIQILSKDGKFQHEVGGYGTKKGKLKSPRGAAVDNYGQILVADSQNRIQIFRYDGTFVSCVDSLDEKIIDSYNIAVTRDGKVFLADFKGNCIKVFKYM